MRIGADTIFLSLVFVVVVALLGLTAQHQETRDVVNNGPDWESPKCMQDTREVRPYAFAVCYPEGTPQD
jgi:hypothetical protein